MQFMSAGPKSELIDLSLYVTGSGATIVGLVGPATKGEPNTAILCTSPTDLINKLGEPTPQNYAMLCAIETLKEASMLYYVRVGNPATLSKASAIILLAEAPQLTFEAKSAGTWANSRLAVAISNVVGKSCRITVSYDSMIVEEYDVSVDSLSANYIETALEYSDYIKVLDNLDGIATSAPTAQTVKFTGGNNGTEADGTVTEDYYGGSGTTIGIDIFRQTYYEVDILAAPGAPINSIASLVSIAEKRTDALVIIDTPNNLSAEEVIAWSNKVAPYADNPSFNSMHSAIYWPWVTGYRDSYNKISYDVPPSLYVLPQIIYNDNNANYWWAPAGLKRGKLQRARGLKVICDVGTMDALYGGINVVNPLAQFPGDGVVIWGQKTTQRIMSATNRINVSRLIMRVRRIVVYSTRSFTFEQNDAITWNMWKNMVDPLLASIKAARGLYDYKVVMDSTTVTPAHIDRLEMPGKVYVQPTKAAEFIPISFIITSTGASFDY